MSRTFGLPSHATAREQMTKAFPPSPGPQPLPPGAPGRATAASVGITESDPLSFFVIGDHGGVLTPGPQNAVSYAIQRAGGPAAAFVYSVGDIVYFHGEAAQYLSQFYEPYGHLELPIVGIPGNHDGDVAEDDAGNPTGRQPLDTFMANFCTTAPQIPAADPQLEFGRHTQTQPWCDWTLSLSAVTIIGLYSNVPEGGIFQASQTDWLVSELGAAPADRPVVVTLHHPPLSVDLHHGGSPRMNKALTAAFTAAGRWPQLILTGHVHDYQRFTWQLGGQSIPTIVIGNSGYHNLHHLAADASPGLDVGGGATFEFGDASEYGFLTVTVSGGRISGSYTGVTPGVMADGSDAKVSPGKDTF